MLNWGLEIWPKTTKKRLFSLTKLRRLALKKWWEKAKSPRCFCIFSPMVLYFLPDGFTKHPGVFLNKGRGVFKNTPPFTEKHPTVNFTTPYHHANDTLSWCNTTPVDLLENTLCLITKDLWR